MIKKFKKVEGRYIEKIYGQDRLAYAMSDTADLYDLEEWAKRGGYPGSVISFYDFKSGNVYTPFPKKRSVMYGTPVFTDGYYFFLQADYSAGMVTLYKYLPGEEPVEAAGFSLDEVSLYNLMITGEKVHVISQNSKEFRCYYPIKFSFQLEPNETVALITDDKVYIEAWIEEGWDDINNCASEDYRFYNKVIIKDHAGNILSEETGAIFQAADGTYWIA